MGTAYLLEAVRRTKPVKVVINVTSDKCYENKDWIWGYRECEPLGGYDPYSSSKACSEIITSALRNSFFPVNQYSQHGVAIASARAGNVIGGGDWAKDRLVPDCIRAWLKGKTVSIRYPRAVRPWQHVLEPLSGYMLLAEKLYEDGPSFSEAWNFGPDEDSAKPVEHVISQLASLWGKGSQYRIERGAHPHEANYLKLDFSKAKTKLGWTPQWNFETALRKTTEWYHCYKKEPRKLRQETLKQIRAYMDCLTC
jgi:CDP-glucose 4,6-dehydratase